MDVHARHFNEKTERVETRYFTSAFLDRAKADDLVVHFRKSMEDLPAQNLLQVSMDGPNVNWSFFKKLQLELNSEPEVDASLFDIGSCGLHVIHGAFQMGTLY